MKNKGISCFAGIRNITHGDYKNMIRMISNRLDNNIRFSRDEELQLSNNSVFRFFTLYFSNKMIGHLDSLCKLLHVFVWCKNGANTKTKSCSQHRIFASRKVCKKFNQCSKE